MSDHPDLAELRTVVARAREQALAVARDATQARAALRGERDALRRERETSLRDLRDAARLGQLGPEQRALVERLERGDTTWRAVVTGTDDHWTAQGFRDSLGARLEQLVTELRDQDPAFREAHDDALRRATDVHRGMS